MKFLCLPGGYCNITSLTTQLGPFADALRTLADAEFFYIQGEFKVEVPEEHAGFFGPPPNWTFACPDGPEKMLINMSDFPRRDTPEEAMNVANDLAGNPTFSCMPTVMDRLIKIIDSEGDIEGVIGYSEGAQVAASLCLEEKRRQEAYGRPPSLKCAVFFCGWPPIHPHTGKLVLASDYEEEPITIPTCHVIGGADPFVDGSMALYNMCETDTADLFDHGGGHIVPRGKKMIDELAPIVSEMIFSVL
ncbi:uncharacterized protein N7511_004802 [Penicillium nucicola]|uniref:uncharacterized protein n=1 Tax=Penicillium nucicola TaxID=1850975 RepID=UPI0025458292|nr:uncharacterized protein N7511_004802 [Penicillium nucicola]KAJ5767186.1 hypothetical protein N7511_004802 [Penicillium nucicola]